MHLSYWEKPLKGKMGKGLVLKRDNLRLLGVVLIQFILLSTIPFNPPSPPIQGMDPPAHFRYIFDIDGDGDTETTITYTHKTANYGQSWVLLPKNMNISREVVSGRLLSSERRKAASPGGAEYIFYDNFTFTYEAVGGIFNMCLSFPFPNGAFITEPKAFFYSPQIGHPIGVYSSVAILLPPGSEVEAEEVRLTSRNYAPALGVQVSMVEGREMVELETAPIDRVLFEFVVEGDLGTIELWKGRYRCIITPRYRDIADYFLELYASSDPILVDLFGIEPERIDLHLFTPSLQDFIQGLGGYMPFTQGVTPDSVYLNIFFIRTITGVIEVAALHELIHAFLTLIGIPPRLVWVQEGLAEYLSTTIAMMPEINHQEGAVRREMSLLLYIKPLDEDLGFLQDWRPGEATPMGSRFYYAASYYIFKTLGKENGGLEFYKKVFDHVRRGSIRDDVDVIKYLDKVSDEDLMERFRRWGFQLVDFEKLNNLMAEAKTHLSQMNPFFQPYQTFARLLLDRAQEAYEGGDYRKAQSYTEISLYLIDYGGLLSLLTYLALAFLFLIVMKSTRHSRMEEDLDLEGVMGIRCVRWAS